MLLKHRFNLRDISKNINDPKNLIVLQKTLDSARATFENAQKITSDLDEITGDPAFRLNLLNLVNGLSNLVSSTEQLDKQVQTAQILEPVTQQLQQQVQMTKVLKPVIQQLDQQVQGSPDKQYLKQTSLRR